MAITRTKADVQPMDRRLDGGANQGDFDDVGSELGKCARLARGTIEQPRVIHDAWPVAAAAWAETLDLEATSGAVFVINDAGEILAINTRACELVGTAGLVRTAIADVLTSEVFVPAVPEATEVPRGVRFVGADAGVVAHHSDGRDIPVELELIALDRRTVMVIARTLAAGRTIDQDDVAEIVHDLKAPLSTIALEAHLLAERLGAVRVPASQLERIERNVTYMDHLVHDLLDLCSLDADQFVIERRPVELCSLIEAVLDRMVPSSERHRVTLEANRIVMACDDRRIERVVANLVDNALKYTPRHSGVVVRLSQTSTSVCIAVIDAGPGIPPGETAHVFEKYRRGNSGRSGTGLGLYVSRKIIEAHGGRIGVESVRGVGSRFYIELPLETARAPRRVLVVDDQQSHASGLAEILGLEGYSASTAPSAAAALASIRQCRPDVLLVDAMLRGPDGIELLQRLRDERIAIPTAILSGLPGDHPRIATSVRDLGCVYVPKPVDIRRLLALLADMTQYAVP
jgi:signal transduction histidine kinase/CheY-like chemotaxis protein